MLLPFTCTSRPTPNKFALSEGGCSYHSLAHPGRHPTNLRSPKVVALTIHLHIQADSQQSCALRRWLLLPFTCTSRPTPNKFALSEGGCSYHSLAHPGRHPTNLRSPKVVALTIHLHIQADTQQICALRRWLLLPFTCTSRPTPNKFALSEGGCSYHSLAHPGRHPTNLRSPKVVALTIHLHIQADTQQSCALRRWLLLPFTCTSWPTPNKFALSEGGCSCHSLAHPGRHPTNLRSPKVVALTIHLHIQADSQQICALRRWLLLPFTCTSRPTPNKFALSEGGCSYHSLAHPGRHPTNLRSPKVVALTIHLHIQADTQQICALRRWLLLPFTCTSRPTPNKFALSEGGCSYHSLAHPGRHPTNLRSPKVVALAIHLHIQADSQQSCALRRWLLLPFTCTSRPTPNKFALSEGGCSYHSLAHPGRHPTNLRSPKVVALTIHLAHPGRHPTNLRSPKVVALTIHLHIQADTQPICALRRWLLFPFTCTSRPTPNKFALSEGGCSYHSLAHPGRHPTNLRSPKVVALTIHLHIQADSQQICALRKWLLLPFTCTSRPTPNKFALSEGGCSYHSLAHPGRHPTNLRSPKVVALTIHLHIQADTQQI